ncbi:MAG: aspartate aminotransferase family protein [Candidatus Thorarchaeota archaeon]
MKFTSDESMKKYQKYLMTKLSPKLQPMFIERGEGCKLWDLEGNEYLDCWAGVAVMNIGHSHPAVTKAVQEQVGKLVHVCNMIYPSHLSSELGERLAKVTPGDLASTFFANSGAEAVECGLKVARKFTKRHEIIALQKSFHGRTIHTLSATGIASRRSYDLGPYVGGFAFAPSPDCYRCSLGLEYPSCGLQCAKMIEDVIQLGSSGDIAAFIAEPVQGEGGIITPPLDYFKAVKKILDKYDILFMADEVQTGFGRTGKMFGIENFGVNPDIMSMAKAIAGGLPMGACIARKEIADSFGASDHATTVGGNPLCCAAALANLDVMENEGLADQAAEKGKYMMKRLNEITKDVVFVGDVRGLGLMIGIDLVKDPKTREPDAELAGRVRESCRKQNVLVGIGGAYGNVIRFQPPLVITEDEMEQALTALTNAFKAEK